MRSSLPTYLQQRGLNARFVRTLGLALLGLLWMSPCLRAQSPAISAGARAAAPAPAQAQLPIAVRVARGEAPLSRLYSDIQVETVNLHRLPMLAPEESPKEEPGPRLRIGVVRPLPQPLDALAESTLYRLLEGELRLMRVVSEGALSLRVRFAAVSLPAGARLFVSSLKNPDEFYGPYTGRGPGEDGSFWTPPVEGDGIVIEYFAPSSALAPSGGTAPFRVVEVSHSFRDPFATPAVPDDAAAPCNQEVTSSWATTANSVGHLRFTNGGEFICSGVLLNNTASTPTNITPYLLTANHCFNTQSAAQSLRVYWLYNSGDTPPATPRTDGATLLATGTASDFTFVRLTGSVPGGLNYAGWTTTVPTTATSVTSIHHPNGSHKRISFGQTNNDSCASNLPGACDNFLKVRWSSGTVEGGSSGGGLWIRDSAGDRLVGQLWGGFASCSNQTGTNFFGSFNVTYPNVSQWLSPCTYAISPASRSIVAGGGMGSVSVTATSGCAWTATSNVSWITISSGASGSGNGTVNYSVAANSSSSPRSGTLMIANQPFNVTQDGLPANNLALTLGVPQTGSLPAPDPGFGALGNLQYTIQVPNGTPQLNLTLVGSQDVDFYVRFGQRIELQNQQVIADYRAETLANSEAMVLTQSSSPPLRSGTYYLAVSNFGPGATSFTLRSTSGAVPTVANVSAASFTGGMASEAILAAFGPVLATATQLGTSTPLPTALAGSVVRVKDATGWERLAPLFFAAPGQINYQVPVGTANGLATVTVINSNGALALGTVTVTSVAPGLFAANANGQGVAAAVALRIRNGVQTYEPMARFDTGQNRFITLPIDLGPASDQIFLILYGTGIRGRSSLAAVTASIGGTVAQVSYAGAQGGFVGLDQVNVLIPRSLIGRGEVDVVLIVDGVRANIVRVAIK